MTQAPEAQALQASPDDLNYPAKGIGRPTTYTPATALLICARLADGETLTEICRTPGMPRRQTVHQWRMRMPAFEAEYAQARAIGMESMADEVLTISDDDTGDEQADGSPNPTAVNRARLMVDTRKFLMGKLAPRVYGDRQVIEHQGNIDHTVTLSDREKLRRLATFLQEDDDAGALIEGTATEAGEEPGSLASPCPAARQAAHTTPHPEDNSPHDDEI